MHLPAWAACKHSARRGQRLRADEDVVHDEVKNALVDLMAKACDYVEVDSPQALRQPLQA
jgi:hypothetical protein